MLIFLIGYLKVWIAVPLSALIVIGLICSVKHVETNTFQLRSFSYKTVIVLLILLIWVFMAGIGGYIWQNRWDHMFRNALFEDLVRYQWPVCNGNVGLCYYFGFWLPAALFGKIFGIEFGYFFQVVWAYLGLSIIFFLICQRFNKVRINYVLVFIFFSGLDVVVYLANEFGNSPLDVISGILNGRHMELLLKLFNSSSNTTLLFWLYNQCIPFWLGFSLMLQQKNNKSIFFIFSLLLLFCPFPCVGLVPYVAYRALKDMITEKTIKNIFTFQNLISIPIALVVALFYSTNNSANQISLLPFSLGVLIRFLLYMVTEYICYLVFIYRFNKNDVGLRVLFITNCFLPFLVMGKDYDFAWRTCIPLSFYLMLLVIKALNEDGASTKVKACLLVMLCFGAITPVNEMIRTVRKESCIISRNINENPRSDSLNSIFDKENNPCYNNFIGSTDSFFFRYLCKTD